MAEFRKILIANRGEIAIRVMRAANEMGKSTVAIFAEEDKLSLHRFKADEAYKIGEGLGPVASYLNIKEIISVAKKAEVDAIPPNAAFAPGSIGKKTPSSLKYSFNCSFVTHA